MSVKAKADKAAADEEENRKRQEERDKATRKKECLKGLQGKNHKDSTGTIVQCLASGPCIAKSCGALHDCDSVSQCDHRIKALLG